jgi:hypothetical protein
MNGRRSRTRRRIALLLTAKPGALAMGVVTHQPALAATSVSVPCGDVTGLSTAITNANAATGSTTITLGANCTYTLTAVDPSSSHDGLPPVTNEIIIEGNGSTITRSSQDDFRILHVQSAGNLTVHHLTITNGKDSNSSFSSGSAGGGILNDQGILTVSSSTITGNQVASTGSSLSAKGGGISTNGTTTVVDSTITGNTADINSAGFQIPAPVTAGGGGISVKGGTLVVRNSTISGNTASAHGTSGVSVIATGGGISAKGGNPEPDSSAIPGPATTITGTTLSGNTATASSATNATTTASGGGMSQADINSSSPGTTITTTLTNSTVAGNLATTTTTGTSTGGGVNVSGNDNDSLKVVNSTIANNTSTSSGVHQSGTVAATLTNTLLATNPGANCGGTIVDGGHNLSFPAADTSCLPTFASGDPGLGALQNNSGPTKTMLPALTGAAVDTADGTVCAAALPNGAGGTDQRGLPRAEVAGDTLCDIGAVEVQPVAAANTPGLPAAGAETSPVSDPRGLPPWAPVVPAAVAAAALVGIARLRRAPQEQPED